MQNEQQSIYAVLELRPALLSFLQELEIVAEELTYQENADMEDWPDA